jgi:hypothetical protein
VIARSPRNADALSNLGIALQEQEQAREAMAAYQRALEARPDHPDAINNLGFLLEQQGRRAEAMALYGKALAANRASRARPTTSPSPSSPRSSFAEGWALADPSRFQIVPPVATPRPFAIPRFGKDDWGDTRKLAVWREQGVGDQVLYATTLPELEARNQPFVLEADPRLVAAFRRAHPRWEVVAPAESEAAFRRLRPADPDRLAAGAGPAIPRELRAAAARAPRRRRVARPVDARRARARDEFVVGISWRSFQPKLRGYVERRKSSPSLPSRRSPPIGRASGCSISSTATPQRSARLSHAPEACSRAWRPSTSSTTWTASSPPSPPATRGHHEQRHRAPRGQPRQARAPRVSGRDRALPLLGHGRYRTLLWYPSLTIVTSPEMRTWEALLARAAELLHGRAH